MHSSNNDDGSISGMFYLVTGLCFVGFFFLAIIVPLAQGTTVAHNNMSTLSEPSVVYQNQMGLIQTVINASPLIAFFVLIFGYIVVAVREKYGVN